MAITAGESAASRMGSWSHGFGRALRTTIRFGPGKCLADSSGIPFGFPTQPKYGVVMRSKKPSREKMMWNFRPQMAQYSSLCTSTIRYLKELTLTKSLVGPGSNTWVKHLERGGGCHGSSRKRSRHAIFEASSVGNPTGYGDSMSWHCMEHHDDDGNLLQWNLNCIPHLIILAADDSRELEEILSWSSFLLLLSSLFSVRA
jgi:hypothetical protein